MRNKYIARSGGYVKKIKISELPKFDVVDHLKTEADIAGYLTAVLEDGDPALFVAAIGGIARAKITTTMIGSCKN